MDILDKYLNKEVKIGFHGHDNMKLAHINAISLFDHLAGRELILDASVGGMGRGAGNLHTELFVNYINLMHNGDYDLNCILSVVSEVTEPISRTAGEWGYSPYFFLTALRRAHPNFATYLLANHDISVVDFQRFLQPIPDDMLTRCTRPYVEELYARHIERNV